jgi:cytoplasmic tRNA 2-thiolation protein 1
MGVAEEEDGGCGSAVGKSMASVESQLAANDRAVEHNLETEITSTHKPSGPVKSTPPPTTSTKGQKKPRAERTGGPKKKGPTKQVMGQCKKCGYLSSQEVCKACVLLEGLNKNRPKNKIELGYEVQEVSLNSVRDELEAATLAAEG